MCRVFALLTTRHSKKTVRSSLSRSSIGTLFAEPQEFVAAGVSNGSADRPHPAFRFVQRDEQFVRNSEFTLEKTFVRHEIQKNFEEAYPLLRCSRILL
jgi:hypothetical protein